jgi:magnesium transporter
MEQFRKYEEDLELIEDAIIENRQAMESVLYSSGHFKWNNGCFCISYFNNVNTVMKTLTVVTIVLTIPTLVASFFGMNVAVPFEAQPVGFWIAIGISILFQPSVPSS